MTPKIIIPALLLVLFVTGCALPGIDNHHGIFSAPRPPAAVPQSEYYHP